MDILSVDLVDTIGRCADFCNRFETTLTSVGRWLDRLGPGFAHGVSALGFCSGSGGLVAWAPYVESDSIPPILGCAT